MRRLRGVVGMGLTWGAAGALLGMGIELVSEIWPNALGTMVDVWPVALGLPCFLGGIAFSTVLVALAGTRRFEEISAVRFATLGGLGGLIVALLPMVLHGLGLVPAGFNLWPVVPAIVVPFTLGAAVVASGTLSLARLAERRDLLGSGRDVSRMMDGGSGPRDSLARRLGGSLTDQSPAPVRTFQQTCRVAPSQWEGELNDGRMFYVRVRHGRLEVRISPEPSEDVTDAVGAPAALLVALDDPSESFMDENVMKDSTSEVLDFAGAIRADADPIA